MELTRLDSLYGLVMYNCQVPFFSFDHLCVFFYPCIKYCLSSSCIYMITVFGASQITLYLHTPKAVQYLSI